MTGKNFEVVENIMCSSQLIKDISDNFEMAADIARTHDLPAVLGNALVNVGTLEMSLDLPAALDTFKEALTVGAIELTLVGARDATSARRCD